MVAAQAGVIEQQAQRIEQLEALVVELQRRLGQNSRNSSKPPSSDGPVKPARRAASGSGRSPGKQPGAPGAGLSRVADLDVVIDHLPQACRAYGQGLAAAAEAGMVVRQVVDIPQITTCTTEHRMYKRRCGCGVVTTATAPREATGPVVYGPNLRALAVYLLVFQHVPVERTAMLLADVCGAPVSTGWVCRTLARMADALADVDRLVKTLLIAAYVLHVDETSTQVARRRYWLHVACTPLLTAFHLHPSRAGSPWTSSASCLSSARRRSGTVQDDPQPARTLTRPRRPGAALRLRPGRAVHQRVGFILHRPFVFCGVAAGWLVGAFRRFDCGVGY